MLVALHLAVGAAALALLEHPGPNIPLVFFLALKFAQAGLMGILAGLGAPMLLFRALLATFGLLYPCVLALSGHHNDGPLISALLGFCALVVAGATGLARYRGFELHTYKPGTVTGPDVSLSFGIRHLLVGMVVVAVLLKIGQSLSRTGDAAVFFSYGLSFAAVAVAAPWAVLTMRRSRIRSVVYVLGALLASLAGPLYIGPEPGQRDLILSALMNAFEALILLASLGLLRRAGLRLVRTGAGRHIQKLRRCRGAKVDRQRRRPACRSAFLLRASGGGFSSRESGT